MFDQFDSSEKTIKFRVFLTPSLLHNCTSTIYKEPPCKVTFLSLVGIKKQRSVREWYICLFCITRLRVSRE